MMFLFADTNGRGGAAESAAWLTGYLDGDGVLDANGLLGSGIDADGIVWTRIAIIEPPSAPGVAMGLSFGPTAGDLYQGYWYSVSGAGSLSGRVYVAGWQAANVACPVPDATGRIALAITLDRAANTIQTRMRGATTATSAVTATGAESSYATYAQMGSSHGAAPYPGRMWGDFIRLGGLPSEADLDALLAGTPPWSVYPGSEIARAWCPALAYEDRGVALIPDVAPLHGGPSAAAFSLTIRNGNASDVVIP